MNLKKIVSIILLAIGIIIILIAFFFMGNGYESYQIQEINTYQELNYNSDKDMYQVKDNNKYILFNQNLEELDNSSSTFTIIYDNYYVKNVDEKYYLMRNSKTLEEFDGYPFNSNQLVFYGDGSDEESFSLVLDGKPLFNKYYQGVHDYEYYYVTKIGEMYYIYDVRLGTVVIEVPNIELIYCNDINLYYGILVKDEELSRIYPLSKYFDSYIEFPYEIVNYNNYVDDIETDFNIIKVDNVAYFVVKNKDSKYGLIDSNGNLVLEVKFDYVENYNNEYFLFRENDKFTLIDNNKVILANEYDEILVYDDYFILEKDQKIEVLKNDKVLLNLTGKLDDFVFANNGSDLLIGSNNMVTLLEEDNIKNYDDYQLLLDYTSNNKPFMYKVEDDIFKLFDLNLNQIIEIKLKDKLTENSYVSIMKNNYKDDYYELSFNYEDKSDLYIINVAKKEIFDKDIYDIYPLERIYYKLTENKLDIYDRNLDIIYSKDNITRLIKVNDTNYFLQTEDNNYILIEIKRIK